MSKMPVIIGLAALAIGTYAAIYFLKDAYELIPVNTKLQEPTQAQQFAGWYKFTDPAGKFQVRLPLLPQQASQEITDPETGEKRQYSMYVAQTENEDIYMVSMISFPDRSKSENDEAIMRALIDGMVSANQENKLSYVKPFAFLDRPALNFEIANSHNIIRGRSFADGQTFYLLSQISKANRDEKKAFNFFADSFTLEKASPSKN